MVARLLRLRLALLGSSFRGGAGAVLRSLLLGALGIAVAVGLAWLPRAIAADDAGGAALSVLLASLPLAAAALAPFLASLKLIEPRQFAGVPARPSSIAASLFISSVLSWPFLWLSLWLLASAVLNPLWGAVEPWAAVIAGALTALLGVAFVRVSSGLLRLTVPRHNTSSVRWTGLLLLLTALPVLVFVLTEAFRAPKGEATAELVRVLGWTPFGAPTAALGFIAGGDTAAANSRFAVAAATLLVLLLIWHLIVARSLTTIERPAPLGEDRQGLEAFERFSARPRSAVAARSLTYWRRDPRYRIALFAIPFSPILMLIALWVAGVEPSVLVLLPLPFILLLLGWSVHNDVALDSTAIWMHVASGMRGRDDRAGRIVPVLVIGLPLAVIGSSLSVTFGGEWQVLPAVVGMNLAILLVSLGVSSVFSALMPYPATRPGDSPFAQPAVQGAGAGLSQTLSMLFSILFAAPAVIVSAIVIVDPSFMSNVLALVIGAVWGLMVLLLGLWLGGKIFDRTGPELVALTQTFD